jgi:UDP-glucose 4-epimerase
VKKKRVIILGSGGFVASHVSKILKKQKSVTCIELSKKSLDLSKKSSSIKLKKIVKNDDRIFFAAARAPVKNMEMLIYNLSFLKNFFKGIKGKKIKKFLYLSSDAVYHDTKKKISENTPTNPSSLHGYMHLLRENYFKNLFNDKLCILRPTLIYGNKDPHNGYGPNKFIRDIKKDDNIHLFGKGEEKRDHIYIEDVAKFISELCVNNLNETFNLATGKIYSFYKISKTIELISGKNNKIKYLKRIGPMPHLGYREFNIRKLKKTFRYIKIKDLIKNLKEQYANY